eukprot:scaffold413_cov134-Isochrysis_galbana.AAC.8
MEPSQNLSVSVLFSRVNIACVLSVRKTSPPFVRSSTSAFVEHPLNDIPHSIVPSAPVYIPLQDCVLDLVVPDELFQGDLVNEQLFTLQPVGPDRTIVPEDACYWHGVATPHRIDPNLQEVPVGGGQVLTVHVHLRTPFEEPAHLPCQSEHGAGVEAHRIKVIYLFTPYTRHDPTLLVAQHVDPPPYGTLHDEIPYGASHLDNALINALVYKELVCNTRRRHVAIDVDVQRFQYAPSVLFIPTPQDQHVSAAVFRRVFDHIELAWRYLAPPRRHVLEHGPPVRPRFLSPRLRCLRLRLLRPPLRCLTLNPPHLYHCRRPHRVE